MENKKLKEKLHEIETQNCAASEYCPAEDTDPTDSSSMKKKKKKRDIMQLENKQKGVSRTPKSVKSKDKQACENSAKKSRSNARKRTRYNDLYDDVEAMFSVMERAYRVLARLENEHPHFLKCMLPSNVSHGFWLHLPINFCSVHLPNHDTSIVLVDEWGNEYKTSYLLGRHGLSAGWRGSSIAHRLLKGDILIFHLIEPVQIKGSSDSVFENAIQLVIYGDIVKDCYLTSSWMRKHIISGIVNIVKELRSERVDELDIVSLQPFYDAYDAVREIEKLNVNVKWLLESLDQIKKGIISRDEIEVLNDEKSKRVKNLKVLRDEKSSCWETLEEKEQEVESLRHEI